jgi:hypothetical protein
MLIPVDGVEPFAGRPAGRVLDVDELGVVGVVLAELPRVPARVTRMP